MDFIPGLISVVIPASGRSPTLAATLRSLAQLDSASGLWECVVVEDGFPKGWPQKLLTSLSLTFPVRWLPRPEQGPASARHTIAFFPDFYPPAGVRGKLLLQRDLFFYPAPAGLLESAGLSEFPADLAAPGAVLSLDPDDTAAALPLAASPGLVRPVGFGSVDAILADRNRHRV